MSNERKLLQAISQESKDALGYYNSEIADDQAKLIDYYYGKPFGNEEAGLSQVVSTDVADTVDGMLPGILKPFISTDDVIVFNAQGPDDEKGAEQETDYMRWVVTQKNDAFLQFYQWVKTGLLQDVGIVKYWWETKRVAEIERYRGITQQAYEAIKGSDDVEITEAETYTDMTPMGPVVMFNIVCRQTREHGYAKYQVVPPEEVRISRRATSISIHEADYVEHRKKMTLSDVRQMGYDVLDDIADGDDDDLDGSQQALARNEDESVTKDADPISAASREVTFREVYIRYDDDEDGIAELRKVCIIGTQILANEETEEIPLRAWTPYIMPFKFNGLGPAAKIADIQLIKSTLLRNSLDNVYGLNNNRYAISENVNMDDVLDNAVNGVVRVKSSQIGNDIMPLPLQPIVGIIQPMMQYMDYVKDNRLGWNRASAGLDPNAINKTATEVSLINESSNEQCELIARTFAETGLSQLMLALHGLCRRHSTKAETIKLRGQWVEIDPRNWKRRADMTISVGLGTSTQAQKKQDSMMLMQVQKEALQAGLSDPSKIYNGLAMLVNSMGRKDVDQFFTNPKDPKSPKPPPMPPPPEVQAAQKMVEAEQIKQQANMQKLQLEQQADAQKFQATVAVDKEEADKERQFKLEVRRMELAFDAEQAALDRQTEFGKIDYQSQANMRSKALDHKTKFDAEQLAKRVDANGEIVDEGPNEIDELKQMMQQLALMVQPVKREISVTFDAQGNAKAVSTPVLQ